MGPNNRRPLNLFFWLGLALVGLLCCGGFNQTLGEEARRTSGATPGPAAAGDREPPKSSLTLEPFYILVEHSARVRVQRLNVTLELHPQNRQPVDVSSPRLREQVYDFLITPQTDTDAQGPERQRALVELVNRYLGQDAVTAVKVDRSNLLLR